jgi:signal transduction histidine kinase
MVWNWLQRHPNLLDAVLVLALAAGLVASAGHRHGWAGAPLLALVQIAPLLVRRRYPLGVLAATTAATAAFYLVYASNFPPVAVAFAVYTTAAQLDRRTSLRAASLAGALLLLCAAAKGETGQLIGIVLMLVAAWVIGDNLGTRRAYTRALEERAERLEREQDAERARAVAEEQARIARELHDVIAHNVSVMVVQADGAAYALGSDPARAREALAAISGTGRQALAEMRALLGVLRKSDDDSVAPLPPVPEMAAITDDDPSEPAPLTGAAEPASLTPMPGIEQLEDLLDQTRAAGLTVSCTIEGEPTPLASGTALAAYRIVQESLTNTRKHAGPLAQASVLLRYSPAALELVIADDGLGRAAACDGAGHGLTGMRERAAMYGGSVRAEPVPAGGFQVTALLPLAPAQAGVA